MKRILKTCALSLVLCISSMMMFSQSASACGNGGCGYVNHGCNSCYKKPACGKVSYYKCRSYYRDCCTGCTYPTVTTYKTWVGKFCGYSCDCGCPKYYTYYKRFTYPVKSVKYYCPVRTCNPCASCCN